VADVEGRALSACSEWDDARWVTRGELAGLGLIRNVEELAVLALAAAR